MPHYTTRAVYGLIAFLLRKTGPERARTTRARQKLRPSWNRVRPARVLACLVSRSGSLVLPNAKAPDLSPYNNDPETLRLANCFAFLLGTLRWAAPATHVLDRWRKAQPSLPELDRTDREDFRTPAFLLRLRMEGGFRRAHLWQLYPHRRAVLVALLVLDDGSDYHVMLLAKNGTWYHKPGSNPAAACSGPWDYDPRYRVRGLYWLRPAKSLSRQIASTESLALYSTLYT